MRVILSEHLVVDYDGYTVVSDIEELSKIDDIEVLIIYDIDIDSFDVARAFPKWVKELRIPTFIYISEHPDTKLKLLINAKDGFIGEYIEDEFYIDSEEDLNLLVEEIQTGEYTNDKGELIESNGGIIHDFIRMVATGDNKANTELIQNQVKEALDGIVSICVDQAKYLQSAASSSFDTFDRLATVVDRYDLMIAELRKQAQEKELESISQSNKAPFSSTITSFTPHKYRGLARVLYIREYTPCAFLTSFLLYYRQYLHIKRDKKVKLIIVTQRGLQIRKRYGDFSSISIESESDPELYKADVVTTNDPKETVMRKLFESNNDIFIVLDRLYQRDPIVTGQVKRISAVSGENDVEVFDLNAEKTIIPFTASNVDDNKKFLCVIPAFTKYPKEENARFQGYYQHFKEGFDTFDKVLELSEEE